MGFLKKHLGLDFSTRPEDYAEFYFRWEQGGKEYGPMSFESMLGLMGKWSFPPTQGRFENEASWRKYSHFIKILNGLKASQDQVAKLAEHGVDESVSAELGFAEARQLLEQKNAERRLEREAERKRKAALPATKQAKKKMVDLEIDYPENVTRAGAKELMRLHEDKQELAELVKTFAARGSEFHPKFNPDKAVADDSNGMSFFDVLCELDVICQEIEDLGVKYLLPELLDRKSAEAARDAFYEARDAGDEAEDLIGVREFYADQGEFKIIGKLPKEPMAALKREVIELSLQGRWNIYRDIPEIVRKHFPDVELRKTEF